jgi:subtilisin family serine protease
MQLKNPYTGFSDLTGKGVRVAVIDSGVHAAHPHVNGVYKTIAIGRDGASAEDVLGHGTAVLAAIKEKAPDAEFVAVRVYYESLRTSLRVLAEAIRWSLAEHVDIINLSLGTTNEAHREVMAELVQEAAARGTLLVSAAETDGTPTLPGSMDGVLGVHVDWDCPRDQFRCDNTARGSQWYASGYPRPLPGVPPRRNLYGVSFAVSSMSGFAARACEALPCTGGRVRLKADIEALLKAEAITQVGPERL